MKLLLFLALIIGGAVFGLKKCSAARDGEDSSMFVGALTSVTGKAGGMLPGFDGAKDGVPGAAKPQGTAGRPALVGPVGARWYKFEHRECPTEEFWTRVISKGEKGVGSIGVSVDPATRTVVFQGPMVKTLDLLGIAQAIDQVPSDCHCKAWIFWVSNSSLKGFDISAFFGGPRETNYGRLSGPIMLGQVSLGDVALRVEALKEITGAVILQSPHLRLFNGKTARIRTGADVPVPVSTTTQNQTQTTVEFRPIGLELIVEPNFYERDQVDLKIQQKNEFISREVKLGDNTVPEISSQELESFVRLRVGEVALIGGVETFVSRTSKGWISRKTESETGFLYILLATYRTEPVPFIVNESDQEKAFRLLDESYTTVDGLDGVLPPLPKKSPAGK